MKPLCILYEEIMVGSIWYTEMCYKESKQTNYGEMTQNHFCGLLL